MIPLLLSALPLPKGTGTWRNYEEVFDLAADGDSVLAATNGGLLRDGNPVPSPAGLRGIESVRPLIVALADGRRFRQEGAGWSPCAEASRTRDLAHGLALDPGDAWPIGAPPPAHSYAALRMGSTAYAGTADGLYRLQGNAWKRQTLPSDLPLARPNGLAAVGGTFVVGGLGGLFVGRPGAWKRVADDAIRQIAMVGKEVWVVHGNGALDKLDVAADRLYPDVLTGNARRPWTSCVGGSGDSPLFGGQGGWAERSGVETFPPELTGDVVTALTGRGVLRWVGAQKSGLLRFGMGKVRRWNPGNGLPDPWITGLLPTSAGLLMGTARRGLFRLDGDAITPLLSPTQRVTALAQVHGDLVVGGMDGAWSRQGESWRSLATGGEETTALVPMGDRLAVVTASGIHFLTP